MHLRLSSYIAPMAAFFATLLLLSRFLEFPTLSSPLPPSLPLLPSPRPFSDLRSAFALWDSHVGCAAFRANHSRARPDAAAIQTSAAAARGCAAMRLPHVSVRVQASTWIPDILDNLYSCACGVTCLWTKSNVLADAPDALLFETFSPPPIRRKGEPLRVYMDIEASGRRSGLQDIFVGYHAEDDVQCTYAGGLFHNGRNHHVSPKKRNDTLIYWSSSRCLPERNKIARKFLSLVPYHSFGKCLNNVGGLDMALTYYPECANNDISSPRWWDHLHCAMSHYKFVLAIENTMTDSYVTEKLFYALDAGSVPIYFGAPNVWDFVPPNSIIDGSKFRSLEDLASYVKALANNPVAYAEYHAWRRCGVMGNYGKARAASLDTLPCRLCELVSSRDGRNAESY